MDEANDQQWLAEQSKQPHSSVKPSYDRITVETSLMRMARKETGSAPAVTKPPAAYEVQLNEYRKRFTPTRDSAPKEYVSKKRAPPSNVVVNDWKPPVTGMMGRAVDMDYNAYYIDPTQDFIKRHADAAMPQLNALQSRAYQGLAASAATKAAVQIMKASKVLAVSASARLGKLITVAAPERKSPRERLHLTDWDKRSIVFRTIDRRNALKNAKWRPT